MPSDTTGINEILNEPTKLLTYLMAIIGALATIAKLISIVQPWFSSWFTSRSVARRLGAELYSPAEIFRATRYYVRPKAQDIDPAHASDEPGSEKAVREDLFDVVDRLLSRDSEFKYSVLLADSGMGKTAFVLNYYKRYLTRRKRFRLEVVPLGRPDADKWITRIEDKPNKVLFLDALDEDELAIVDHRQRLHDLCVMTQEFLHVLITCRTQFFPTASDEPGRTGVLNIAATAAGQSSEYKFHKRYLSPFDAEQIDQFLAKRYSFLQRKRRLKAKRVVQRAPRLTMRPMLLSYVDELLQEEREYNTALQLYEQMVNAWLVREEGKVEGVKKDDLLAFCKQLAYDLYANKDKFRGERISLSGIGALARQYGFNIEAWKLSGRSLLNRDAENFYKFSHRSIMEYLFVRRFFELRPRERERLIWTDQMKVFLIELARQLRSEAGFVKIDLTGAPKIYDLRNTPEMLDEKGTAQMITRFDFFCAAGGKWKNPQGRGIPHSFEVQQNGRVVYDGLTDLTWQQSGSTGMTFKDAQAYVEKLNRQKFCGYSDWRLPTLDEAMSLMAPKKSGAGLYIDPVFDKTQQWIWTADKESASRAWVVDFGDGGCGHISRRQLRLRASGTLRAIIGHLVLCFI